MALGLTMCIRRPTLNHVVLNCPKGTFPMLSHGFISAIQEIGPTLVGDEWSDKELMEYLGATLSKPLGNNFMEYKTPDPPRIVMNKLDKKGYKMVSSCGIGQTCIWTFYKEDDNSDSTETQMVNGTT